jgi:hypothetical protein
MLQQASSQMDPLAGNAALEDGVDTEQDQNDLPQDSARISQEIPDHSSHLPSNDLEDDSLKQSTQPIEESPNDRNQSNSPLK